MRVRLGFAVVALGLLPAAAYAQTATTITLSVKVGGTVATSAPGGTAETLTATVLNGSSVALTQGTVLFCDQGTSTATPTTTTACRDNAYLGTAQITAAGIASINVRLAPLASLAVHNLFAKFVGTTTYLASVPTANSSFTVNSYVTGSVLSTAGNSASYTLTNTVVGGPVGGTTPFYGKATPSGSVSFTNTTTNTGLGTASLSSASQGIQAATAYTFAPGPKTVTQTSPGMQNGKIVVSGDFNNDGILDLVEFGTGTFAFLKGNGDGTFTNSPTVAYTETSSAVSVVVGDFDNDGKLDMMATTGAGVYFYKGNGDGTFTGSATTYRTYTQIVTTPTNYFATSVAVGDFDGDGVLDVAVGYCQTSNTSCGGTETGYVIVYSGVITAGTYTVNTTTPLATLQVNTTGGGGVTALTAADLNNDGVMDLVVATTQNVTPYWSNLYTYLNSSPTPGTFTASVGATNISNQSGSPTGTLPVNTLVVADMNNDGVQDIIYPYSGSVGIQVFGTTTSAYSFIHYAVVSGSQFAGVAVGDFNGDGILDVAVGCNAFYSAVAIFTGTGTGTSTGASPTVVLNAEVAYTTIGSGPYSIIAGDFTGSGATDFALAANSIPNGTPTISNAVGANGVVTFTTTTQALYAGQLVYLSGLGTTFAALNGTEARIISVPSTTSFTIASAITGTESETVGALTTGGTVNAFLTGQAASASLSTAFTGTVPQTFTSTYSSTSPAFAGVTSNTATLYNLTIAASTTSATEGSAVTLTAQTSLISGSNPTGLVYFYYGSTLIGSAAPTSAGLATLSSVTTLPAGHLTLSAFYSGDLNYPQTTSQDLSITITTTSTATKLIFTNPPTTTGPYAEATAGVITLSIEDANGEVYLPAAGDTISLSVKSSHTTPIETYTTSTSNTYTATTAGQAAATEAITAVSANGATVTFTTAAANAFTVGQLVYVNGLNGTGTGGATCATLFNQIAYKLTAVTSSTFTAASLQASCTDSGETAATGVTPKISYSQTTGVATFDFSQIMLTAISTTTYTYTATTSVTSATAPAVATIYLQAVSAVRVTDYSDPPGTGATATATVSGGSLTITPGLGGSGYTTAPTVLFSGSTCTTTPVYTSTIAGGSVTGYTLVTAGTGCTVAGNVVITSGVPSNCTNQNLAGATPAPHCRLRDALAYQNLIVAGVTTIFDNNGTTTPQVINLSSNLLTVAHSSIIVGPGPQYLTINGQGLYSIFNAGNTYFGLSGMTLANGYNSTTGGGALTSGTTNLNVNNVVFIGNYVNQNASGTILLGGAIYENQTAGIMNISNSSFINNGVGSPPNVTVTGVDATGSTTVKFYTSGPTNFVVTGSIGVTLEGLTGTCSKTYNNVGPTALVLTAVSNTAPYSFTVTATGTGCTETGDSGVVYITNTGGGGAIAMATNSGVKTNITNSTFIGNNGFYGGALALNSAVAGSSAEITNSTFYNNSSIKYGAAIYSLVTGTMINDTVVGNNSYLVGTSGGAISGNGTTTATTSNITLYNSVVAANYSTTAHVTDLGWTTGGTATVSAGMNGNTTYTSSTGFNVFSYGPTDVIGGLNSATSTYPTLSALGIAPPNYYGNTSNTPGVNTNNAIITNEVANGTTVVFTTAAAHSFTVGQVVYVSGLSTTISTSCALYLSNQSYTVTAITSTSFTANENYETTNATTMPSCTSVGTDSGTAYGSALLTMPVLPGSPMIGKGTFSGTSATVTAVSVVGTGSTIVATFTVGTNSFIAGDTITITGLSSATCGALFNGRASTIVSVPSTTSFTVNTTVPACTDTTDSGTATLSAPSSDERGFNREPSAGDAGALQSNLALTAGTVSNQTAGITFTPSPTAVLTESGHPILNANAPISASISLGTLDGTDTVNTDSTGTATFSGIYSDTAETTTSLILESGSDLVSAISNTFSIAPAVTHQVIFTTAPLTPIAINTAANTPGAPITITEQDAYNNPETADNSSVIYLTVTAAGYTTQTYTATVAAGVATFNLSSTPLTISGTYTYTASVGPLLSATVTAAATELVNAGAFANLLVTVPTATLNVPSAVTVSAVDAYGNIVTSYSSSITITPSSSDTTASFYPSSHVLNSGTYTFSATFDHFGTGFSVTATPTSGTAATNSSVSVDTPIWLVNANGQVDKIGGSGASVTGAVGSNAGSNAAAGGVAFDNGGNAWSVTAQSSVLYEVNSAGVSQLTASGGGLNLPVAVAVDGGGFIWVANSGANSVSEFTNGGTAVSGSNGYGSMAMSSAPSTLALDSSGGIWIASKTGGTITHILGVATPVATPTAFSVANGTVGVAP